MSREVKRRLTIYPGQVSMVFTLTHAEEFLMVLMANLPNISDLNQRGIAKNFLEKMESAINTGRKLTAKQSAMARGNF
jgi:hypothetical protein